MRGGSERAGASVLGTPPCLALRANILIEPRALNDYNRVLRLCEEGGFAPDPYVLNSRGNAYGSLGDWSKAKDDYALAAERLFTAKGCSSGARTTQRLDGAIYAFSNLALAEVELGNEEKALSMFKSLERRSPNGRPTCRSPSPCFSTTIRILKTPKTRGFGRVTQRAGAQSTRSRLRPTHSSLAAVHGEKA